MLPGRNRNGETILLRGEGADGAEGIGARGIFGSIEVENYVSRTTDALTWRISMENAAFDLGAGFARSVAKEEEESTLAVRDGKEADRLSVEDELSHAGGGLIGDLAQGIGNGKAARKAGGNPVGGDPKSQIGNIPAQRARMLLGGGDARSALGAPFLEVIGVGEVRVGGSDLRGQEARGSEFGIGSVAHLVIGVLGIKVCMQDKGEDGEKKEWTH